MDGAAIQTGATLTNLVLHGQCGTDNHTPYAIECQGLLPMANGALTGLCSCPCLLVPVLQ